ncbi:MAG TPA: VIT domain-containing protein [Verrucomicrobiae bacterium]
MMRILVLGLVLSSFLSTMPAFPAGIIIVDEAHWWPQPPPPVPPPHPPRPPRPIPVPPRPFIFAPLELVSHHVNARVTDQFATTSVEQEFFNPNDGRLEGTFIFPVPKGAQVRKFTMEIGGKPVEAELLPAEKARQIYEDIVRRAKDPALLEYAGRDLFKVRIFPIEPRERKRITLRYEQLLKADSGLVAYSYPLSTEKFSAQPVKDFSLKLTLESKRPLKSIYSPSHTVEIKRDGTTRATVGFEAREAKADTDFQLYFAPEGGDVGLNLLTYRADDGDGYFLLLASPGMDVKQSKVIPKDVAFVLDTSGSMAGKKLEQAKKALQFCVENLNDGDRFEVLRFSTDAELLFNQLSPATRANRDRAESFIKDLKAIGGTAIYDALQRALKLRAEKSDRPFVIIFLTDGLPTVGETNEERIVAGITAEHAATTRIFCFGIGTDVNAHLLDKIAEKTRAFSQYVLPDEDLELKVSTFYSKIKEPVLANPRIEFPDGLRVTKLYPSPLPDLFKGEQLVLAGRYAGKDAGRIRLEGTVNGERREFTYDTEFSSDAREHDFIPRLWATRRVGYLLDEIRLHGESKELKDEVTDLARQYGIVTPYTAYLILEDEARRNVPLSMQSLPQLREDRPAVEAASTAWNYFSKEKSELAGVAGARSSVELKLAENAGDALRRGQAEAGRSLGLSIAPLAAPGKSGNAPLVANPTSAAAEPVRAAKRLDDYVQNSRYVAGKNFFQNGAQWVDADAQKEQSAKRVQLKFGSKEYFDFYAKNTAARPWLALGRQVQFVFNGTAYEVTE